MEAKVDENGSVTVTSKSMEVSTGGMTVLILTCLFGGLVTGVLLTNACRMLNLDEHLYKERKQVTVNRIQHENHWYLFTTVEGRDEVYGLCHDPRCGCRDEEEAYKRRSLEGLKYGVSMIGGYMQSAVEQAVNNGKGGTNEVSVVPHFERGRLVEQTKRFASTGERCDKDGTPNPKGKYMRRELSTSKVVDTSEIGNDLKSGQTAPNVSARIYEKEEGM